MQSSSHRLSEEEGRHCRPEGKDCILEGGREGGREGREGGREGGRREGGGEGRGGEGGDDGREGREGGRGMKEEKEGNEWRKLTHPLRLSVYIGHKLCEVSNYVCAVRQEQQCSLSMARGSYTEGGALSTARGSHTEGGIEADLRFPSS